MRKKGAKRGDEKAFFQNEDFADNLYTRYKALRRENANIQIIER